MQSIIRLFADDCTIYRPINNKNDQQILQSDLTNLTKWEQKWRMAFNASKCNVMHLTRSKNPIKEPYYMHGKQLEVVQDTKYLGITIKDNLIWNLHIKNIVSSANQVQGMLSRNIKEAPQQTKITAINTLVQPRELKSGVQCSNMGSLYTGKYRQNRTGAKKGSSICLQ